MKFPGGRFVPVPLHAQPVRESRLLPIFSTAFFWTQQTLECRMTKLLHRHVQVMASLHEAAFATSRTWLGMRRQNKKESSCSSFFQAQRHSVLGAAAFSQPSNFHVRGVAWLLTLQQSSQHDIRCMNAAARELGSLLPKLLQQDIAECGLPRGSEESCSSSCMTV